MTSNDSKFDSEAILDKIQKLLNKAEKTTAAEAEALTEKAEQLMMKYAISQAMLDAKKQSGQRETVIIQKDVRVEGIYRIAFQQLAHQISLGLGTVKMFKSQVYDYEKRDWQDTVKFIGFESDVQQAEILFVSLIMQSSVAMREWYLSLPYRSEMTGSERYRARRSFVLGFAEGVRERLDRVRLAGIEEAGTGAEIALRDRFSVVEDWVSKNINSAPSKSNFLIDQEATRQGRAKGLVANTGGSSVQNKQMELQ